MLLQDQACLDEADYNLTSADLQKVKDLIQGHSRPLDKAFMFDIVANSRNGLDVDKLDYLPRDAYHTVRSIPGDFKRLQHFISVSPLQKTSPARCILNRSRSMIELCRLLPAGPNKAP